MNERSIFRVSDEQLRSALTKANYRGCKAVARRIRTELVRRIDPATCTESRAA